MSTTENESMQRVTSFIAFCVYKKITRIEIMHMLYVLLRINNAKISHTLQCCCNDIGVITPVQVNQSCQSGLT